MDHRCIKAAVDLGVLALAFGSAASATTRHHAAASRHHAAASRHHVAALRRHAATDPQQPWRDPSQPAEVRADELLSALTSDEKIQLALGNFAALQQSNIKRMLAYKIGALPVVEHGKLIGILTRTDLLHAFLQAQVALPAAA